MLQLWCRSMPTLLALWTTLEASTMLLIANQPRSTMQLWWLDMTMRWSMWMVFHKIAPFGCWLTVSAVDGERVEWWELRERKMISLLAHAECMSFLATRFFDIYLFLLVGQLLGLYEGKREGKLLDWSGWVVTWAWDLLTFYLGKI